jgi:hypothetical protein
MEQMARECGSTIAALPPLLNQLVIARVLTTWQAVRADGELRWRIGPNGFYYRSGSEIS